jgi:hypothetical protein
MASRVMLLGMVFCAAAAVVQGTAEVSKLYYTIGQQGATKGFACHSDKTAAATECNGGYQRPITSTWKETNVIPQLKNVYLRYEGTLPTTGTVGKVSLVDSSLNNNNPCDKAFAAAAADNIHSGKIDVEAAAGGAADLGGTGGMFKIPMTTDDTMLDATRTYTICQATGTGDTSDTSWQSTGIQVKVAKLWEISFGGYGLSATNKWSLHDTESTSGPRAGVRKFITGVDNEAGVIPHHSSLTMYYQGTVLETRWISFVDQTLNNNNPCQVGSIAAAPKDSAHSGSLQADSGTKTFKVDTTALSAAKVFAVCYTESGGITSSQWRDSGIRVKRSAIHTIEYGVDAPRFGRTTATASKAAAVAAGIEKPRPSSVCNSWMYNSDDWINLATDTFPQVANAALRYTGDLPARARVALVALSAAHHDNPCGYSIFAGLTAGDAGNGGADARVASGASQAGVCLRVDAPTAKCDVDGNGVFDESCAVGAQCDNANSDNGGCGANGFCTDTKTVVIAQASNNLLDESKLYAVCYTEGDGSKTDTRWSDSYVRFTITQIEALRHHSVTHVTTGVLPNTGDVYKDDQSPEALHLGFIASTKMKSVDVLSVNTHQIALVKADNNQVSNSPFAYDGETTTPFNAGTSRYEPCKVAFAQFGLTDNTLPLKFKSGLLTPVAGSDHVLLDTATLDTGTVAGSTLTKQEFAVCYTTTSGTTNTWYDSGIRLTVGKVRKILHGKTAAHYGRRDMKPVEATTHTGALGVNNKRLLNGLPLRTSLQTGVDSLPAKWAASATGWCHQRVTKKASDDAPVTVDTCLSPGLASARNVIPQLADQKFTYVSNNIENSILGDNKYFSLVDASLNGNKPCDYGLIAAAAADSTHSGSIKASTTDVTIPQTTLLDDTKVYAVCYSMDSGTVADPTWADSYIRVTVSAVSQISSLGVTHSVSKIDGQVASRVQTTEASKDTDVKDAVTGADSRKTNLLDLTYAGSLPAGKYLSLVAEQYNDGFPCSTSDHQGYQTASDGPTKAKGAETSNKLEDSNNDKKVVVETKTLDAGSLFAVCYSYDGASTWFDSGVRFTRSKIYSMRYESGVPGSLYPNYYRDQTSVFLPTNRIPQSEALKLQYIDKNQADDELTDNKWVAMVTAANDPCMSKSPGAATAATADAFDFDTSGFTPGTTYTVCYASEDPGATYDIGSCDGVANDAARKCDNDGDGVWNDICMVGSTCKPTDNGCGTGETCSATTQYLWRDSYIHLTAGAISSLDQYHGQWKGACITGQAFCDPLTSMFGTPAAAGSTIAGRLQSHTTVGQLPQFTAGATGLDLGFKGYADPLSYISLVDASLHAAADSSGISIASPCTSAGNAPDSQTSSKYSGPKQGSGTGFCTKVGTNPTLAGGAKCDSDGDGTFADTCLTGSFCDPSATNPCGTGGKCGGSIVNDLDTTILDKTKTFALCYTEGFGGATPAPNTPVPATAVWADSGIRVTVSKIKEILTSSRHTGIAARVQTSVFKPTNRVPSSEGMKLTYVGELGASKHISLVDVDGVAGNSRNPCVQGSAAAAARSTSSTGALTADANKVFTLTPGAGAYLLKTKYYAVCYAEDGTGSGGTGNAGTPGAGWWLDSGIRFGVTDVEALRVVNIDIVTVGQVPNSHITGDEALAGNLKFSYVGLMAAHATNNYLSLVDETQNSEFPCGSAFGGKAVTVPDVVVHTTAITQDMQDFTGAKKVELTSPTSFAAGVANTAAALNTQALDTSKTFALCYATGGGAAGDASWQDSGIRVSVTKIWNLLASSMVTGPGCPNVVSANVLDPDCKEDTKPRDQISMPLSTNRLPIAASQTVTYVGTAPAGTSISIVRDILNPSGPFAGQAGEHDSSASGGANPCVDPAVAAAAKDAYRSGPYSTTGSKAVSIDTSTLDATQYSCSRVRGTNRGSNCDVDRDGTFSEQCQVGALCNPANANEGGCGTGGKCEEPIFAVCYAESATTWRDSYIRVKASQVRSLSVLLPHIKVGTTSKEVEDVDIKIFTHGQIPYQVGSKQVRYKYNGALAGDKWISLVDASRTKVEEPSTGFRISTPCDNAAEAGTITASGTQLFTGQKQASSSIVSSLDTTSTVTTSVAEYALCYSSDGGASGKWSDSGIRITLSQINELEYFGTNADKHYCSSVGGTGSAANTCDKDFDGTYDEACAAPGTGYSLCKPNGANKGGCGDTGSCDPVIPARKRTMDTEYKATNKLPQADIALVFQGPLNSASARFISLIAADLNDYNPCVNSALTAASPSSTGTGVLTTGTHETLPANEHKRFQIQQPRTCKSSAGGVNLCASSYANAEAGVWTAACSVGAFCQPSQTLCGCTQDLLDADRAYAVCYATTNSGVGDKTWRDSYVRLTISQIQQIASYQVTHVTTGQLASHPQLKIDYEGSLAANASISIVKADHGTQTIGTASYNVPCSDSAVAAASADWTHSGAYRTTSVTSKTVSIDTVDLKPYDAGEVDYAVCYRAAHTGHFVDSGIRVTFPELVNMRYDSGYSDGATVCLAVGGGNIGSKCDADFDGQIDDTCVKGAVCPNPNLGTCANVDTPLNTCDTDEDGIFGETCANGKHCIVGGAANGGCGTGGTAACNPVSVAALGTNGGCGASGICGYQEICTAVGGKEVGTNCDADWDGSFSEACVVNAQCRSTNPYNGGCGTHGVCGRQGTPVREQTSWDQVDGNTLIETPTNRIPQEASTALEAKYHKDAQAGQTFKVSLVAVDAKADGNVATATTVNVNNPCVLPYLAAHGKGAQNQDTPSVTNAAVADGSQDRTDVATVVATTKKGRTLQMVTIPQSSGYELLKNKIYAVCYSKTGGTNVDPSWRDSYVRLKVTRLTSLTTALVTHLTTGQIPNVVPSDLFKLTYNGNMLQNRFVSLVDHTLNSGLPCDGSVTEVVATGTSFQSGTHSGRKQAQGGQRWITDFDTTYMHTNKTFALCYAEGAGDAADNWYDSGIRLTVTKLWNTQFASGVTGPAPLLTAATKDGICRPSVACAEKPDTKVREMTSNTLATNRLPQSENHELTYQGTLPENKWVSLVALGGARYGFDSDQKNNPCVQPFLAASGDAKTAATTVTGSIQAAGRTFTIAQAAAASRLDKTKTFAVCYADTRGTFTDHTWRDSYIRLKISLISDIVVLTPLINDQSTDVTQITTHEIPIRTVGQITAQFLSEQVQYRIDGTLSGAATVKMHLVDADTVPVADLSSGITNKDPCTTVANGDGVNIPANEKVTVLDSSGLDASKIYSLCYTENSGTDWTDSGIRITVPKLTGVQYEDSKNVVDVTARKRTMTSLHRATHRFPRIAGSLGGFDYVPNANGGIANDKFVSFVHLDENSNNPCVNPAVAAQQADTLHSGKVTATGTAFTLPQTVLLDPDKVFAVCYATTDGSTTDTTWRDSYIRLRPTKVTQVKSIGVTHKTTGQIANHPKLLVEYMGSLADSKYLSLVDATRGAATLGGKTYPFPCAKGTEAYKATNDASHSATTQSTTKTVTIGTSNLWANQLLAADVSTGSGVPAAGSPRYYAVCYSSTDNDATSPWEDSGIRVTIAEIIGLQVSSGYGTNRLHPQGLPAATASRPADGTLWRDMTSEPLAMNRLAQMSDQPLQYVFSRYSSGCRTTGDSDDADCANGDGKHISIVDASENGGDPCVLSSKTNPNAASATATDVMTATSGTKQFMVDASGLDATKTYAVCYSKGAKLWSATANDWNGVDAGGDIDGTAAASYWQDTYIRLKISKLESITTLGIEHRTYGQVPDVMPTDKIDFVLNGDLGTGSTFVSLVDASLNSLASTVSESTQSHPCSSVAHAGAAFDSFHSGAIAAADFKCHKFDVTGAQSTCKNPGTGNFNAACAQGALCKPGTANGATNGGCGNSGQCRRVVSDFQTHGLATSHHSGTRPGESTQYLGVPVDNTATGKQTHVVTGDTTVKGRWFAVCYSEGGTAYEDSGLRVTVSSVYNTRLESGHLGIPDRDHTSLFLATNRLPRQGTSGSGTMKHNEDQELKYLGDLEASKWLSIVDVTGHICRNVGGTPVSKCDIGTMDGVFDGLCAEGSACDPTDSGCGTGDCVPVNNPCVNGARAGAAADILRSGPKQDAGGAKKVTFDLNGLLGHDGNFNPKTYTVCYSHVGGNAASVDWYDSYIRFQMTEIGHFGTKSVMHKTYGQIPLHKSGLVYDYLGRLPTGKKIALVKDDSTDATITSAVEGYSQELTTPCMAAKAAGTPGATLSGAQATEALNAQVDLHSGVVRTLDTTALETSATFALCFALGDGSNSATQSTSGWLDSGIRLTVSKLTTVIFSGYLKTEAVRRNKQERSITSVLPSLQSATPATAVFAPVLPKAASVPLRYAGNLAHSAYISIVRADQNFNNPCVEPTVAAADASDKTVGPTRACKSQAQFKASVCTAIGSRNVGNNCDTNYDGVYHETCVVGAKCLHTSDPVNNGGCGTDGGVCAGPWITQGTCQHVDHGDGSDDEKNKEVSITGAPALETHDAGVAKTFAVCYSTGNSPSNAMESAADLRVSPFTATGRTITSSSSDWTLWRDSYIRLTWSEITSVIGTGVTHTDHGYIANHEEASKLRLGFTTPLTSGNVKFSLVDETLGKGQVKKDRSSGGGDAVAGGNAYTAAAGPTHSLELNDVDSANEPCVWKAQAEYAANSGTTAPRLTTHHLDDHTGVTAQVAVTSGFTEIMTDGLDTSLNYQLCYTTDSNNWYSTGITLKISKLITLRDNVLQLPLLKPTTAAAGSVFSEVSKFKRDLTSSRAKIGRTSCLVIGTSPADVCDKDDDGIFEDTCEFGALCDPSNPDNGGCGSGFGVCASGLVTKAHTPAGAVVSASWATSVYNTGAATEGSNASSYQLHHHKLRQVKQFKCATVSVGATSTCDVDHDGVYAETCVQHALCDPDNTNLVANPNYGCGTSGTCVGELELEYLGSLQSQRKIAIVDTRLNQGDPCVEQTLASQISHVCATVDQDESTTCDSDNDAVFDDHCVPGAYCKSGTALNGGCGTSGSCVPGTSNLNTWKPLRQTGELTSTAASRFTILSDIVSKLDTSKKYTVCYNSDGSGWQSGWQDSYIRLSMSKVEYIRTHQITHRVQGHIARAKSLAVQYGGTLETHKWLSLVDEATALTFDAPVCTDAAAEPTAKQAMAGTRSVILDTSGLDSTKNYAVCYSEDGASFEDSGIRVTVSLVEKLTYNKKSTSGSQQGTVDYFREMDSRNYEPSLGLSDIVPHALNRIPQAANMKFLSTDTATQPLRFALVATDFNKDFNPCGTVCNDDNACNWNTFDGPMGAATASRSGVAKADASKVFTVAQASTYLDDTKTFAVCYAQQWLNNDDPVGTGTTWQTQGYNSYTMRDSYIRLKPSKIMALRSYRIRHFTRGDVASKAKLTVSFPGSQLASDATVALVDDSANNYQPCVTSVVEAPSPVTSLHSGKSSDFGVIQKCDGVGTGASAICDVNKDGRYTETCIQNAYTLCKDSNGNPVAGCGCGAGQTTTKMGHYHLRTIDLSTDATFALCYKETSGSWSDAGIRLKTPKVQSITYASPERVITADSCFGGDLEEDADGLADCAVRKTDALATLSDAHKQIGAMLPRAADVQVTYGGPLSGAGMAAGQYLSLVEQEKANKDTPATPASQDYNPCRNAELAAAAPDETYSPGGAGTIGQDSEGGMRLHSGPVQGAGNDVTFPQTFDTGSVTNFLDYTKTYAVCYCENPTGTLTADECWRDSYIRVTLSKIKTLSMVHTGYPGTLLDITTVGTLSNVPSLGLQWDGSLMHNQWLRITAASVNNGAPCDKSQATLSEGDTSTEKISSLAGSKRLTLDTSVLANTAVVPGYFVVCYATGDGSATDATWHDSGLRVRFVRWTNPQKHRVATAAPVRLTFKISTSYFLADAGRDKIALIGGATDCSQAPQAPVYSDGNSVKRSLDYTCTEVDAGSALSTCDSNFDDIFSDRCIVGAQCKASGALNGGCGAAGVCSGTIQLPTGESFAQVIDPAEHVESRLLENKYTMCVCLGSSDTGASYGLDNGVTSVHADANSYGPANGNGGCDDANEWTVLFSSTTAAVDTLNVISLPQLGRHEDPGGQLTLRTIAGVEQQFDIKANMTTAGFQVANGDKIYFAPRGLGCGHITKYSGAGTYQRNHQTNSYVGTGVDRRWRTMVTHMCTAVHSTPGSRGNNCDSNYDGVYTDLCEVGARCNPANINNGGCGAANGCGSPIPAGDTEKWTEPEAISGYDAATMAASFTTPSSLTTAQTLVACFATLESLAGTPADATDYTQLNFGLEVFAMPRLGPYSSPGHIHAIENSSPSFTVNPMKPQDQIYFMPQTQSLIHPATDDCTKHVCRSIGGSNVQNTCDSNNDGVYGEKCEHMSRCQTSNPFIGGCGTGGECVQMVPTSATSLWTTPTYGQNFVAAAGTVPALGQIKLPSGGLAVPANVRGYSYPTAYYLVACFIPAGAVNDIVSNVVQLPDRLTIFKEPTDSLVTSWFQYQVHELRFTQPQAGYWHPEKLSNFAGGQAGDMVVLQKDSCAGVESITASSYQIYTDSPYNNVHQTHSARFTLEETGNVTMGDENGGAAGVVPLAIGKVNELGAGIYKICYATESSGGEAAEDFVPLSRTLEILPPPATKPSLSVPRSVVLGQDIVVSWASNIALQDVMSDPNSWLGLFVRGECSTDDMHDRHKCWKAYQFIAARQLTGTVIFSFKDYKIAGEYEVRYFQGDTRNGQGEDCQGLQGVNTETYVTCQLEAAIVSEPIKVLGQDMDDTEQLGAFPGLEAVFGHGNRGRYHRQKLT